jgi:fructuronate reductase
VRLNSSSLKSLPADVRRSGYDASARGIGIIHLGIGAFHRAHQAVYVDDLMAKAAGDWRILGVSLRSAGVRDQLVPQDGLYTLVERDGAEERLRIISSIADVLVAPENPQAVIDAIAAPTTHIVSLTITEKGYCHDPASGEINWAHADIVHDLANLATPRSAIGYLAAGLKHRMKLGAGPTTLMSCDNLPHNGSLLKAVLTAFVAKAAPEVSEWLAANVSFPATMVDRIVPATTDTDIARLEARLGMADQGMVKAEPFTQWVIEDDFAGPRPAFEDVGAQMVADVRPFELAKLRMLNGSHSTIAYLGLFYGHETVDQAMNDPRVAGVVDALMVEAAYSLPIIPGLDPEHYAEALKGRFRNAALQHRLSQIAMDGSQKLPQRLLGTIADLNASGRDPRAAATGVAAWMRHFSGPFVNDPLSDTLKAAANDNPEQLISNAMAIEPVFGPLGQQPWLRDLLMAVMPR